MIRLLTKPSKKSVTICKPRIGLLGLCQVTIMVWFSVPSRVIIRRETLN
jgi:hypothetical protein